VSGPFEVLTRPLTLLAKSGETPAARDPVAWWKFDETAGAETAASSAGKLSARVRGAAQWQPAGRDGGALELDGISGFLDCGDSARFDFSNGLTISLWVNPRDFKKGVQTLIAKGNDTWRIQSAGKTGKLTFALSGPQPSGKERRTLSVTSKEPLADDRWHHVVAVYDGRRMALYLNGELQDSGTATGRVALTTEPLWLGNNAAARGQFFSGALDDARLYGRGLSDAEIKALYRSYPMEMAN
jgi:hypothetical protein